MDIQPNIIDAGREELKPHLEKNPADHVTVATTHSLDDFNGTDRTPSTSTLTTLAPDIQDAFDKSWTRNEEAYRYLGL